jgi:hypothetical protein
VTAVGGHASWVAQRLGQVAAIRSGGDLLRRTDEVQVRKVHVIVVGITRQRRHHRVVSLDHDRRERMCVSGMEPRGDRVSMCLGQELPTTRGIKLGAGQPSGHPEFSMDPFQRDTLVGRADAVAKMLAAQACLLQEHVGVLISLELRDLDCGRVCRSHGCSPAQNSD